MGEDEAGTLTALMVSRWRLRGAKVVSEGRQVRRHISLRRGFVGEQPDGNGRGDYRMPGCLLPPPNRTFETNLIMSEVDRQRTWRAMRFTVIRHTEIQGFQHTVLLNRNPAAQGKPPSTRITRAGSSYLFVENRPYLLRQIMFGEGLSEQHRAVGQPSLMGHASGGIAARSTYTITPRSAPRSPVVHR